MTNRIELRLLSECAEIWLLFKPLGFGQAVKVKCEGWGQLANDSAATGQAMYHIKNKRPMWWATYAGWQEIEGHRCGDAPKDFVAQYEKYWASWGR